MKKHKWHFAFWIPYFLFCYFSDLIVDVGSTLFTEIIFFATNNLYLFYSTLFIFRKFSLKNSCTAISSVIYLFFGVGFFFLIRYITRYILLAKYVDPNFGISPINEWIINSIIWIINYFFYAAAYVFFESSTKKQVRLNELLIEQFNGQKEKLELENTLLKAQINPHFLYNTLNFLYAKSLPLSNELSEAIMKLSEIMHYSLRGHGIDGLSTLNEELIHMHNTIDLAKLRFSNKLNLHTDFSRFTDDVRVVPLVFLTLLENIFKHAILTDDLRPAFISLKQIDERLIKFTTRNAKRLIVTESGTGIGLKNVRARLKDVYNDKFEMLVSSDECFFEVIIIMPIIIN